jgi:hypothetical protein
VQYLTLVVIQIRLIVFVLLRLFVPFLGFKKYLPPAELPAEVKALTLELKEVVRKINKG